MGFVERKIHFYSTRPSMRLVSLSPWFKLLGALLAFVLLSLYSASHSELGNQISTGESPGFAWVRMYMDWLLLLGLAYLILASVLQHLWFQVNGKPYRGKVRVLAGLEFISLGTLAIAVFLDISGALIWGHLLLQIVLLGQIILALWISPAPEFDASLTILGRNEKNPFLFLFFL
jgi:hypothetical protein